MSEEHLTLLEEIAEVICTKIEFGDMVMNDLDYFITCLREQLKDRLDKDYETGDDIESSESDSDDDLIKEKVKVKEDEDGFYSITDNELVECNRVGKRIKK